MFKSFEFSNNELLFGDNKCNTACFNFPDNIVIELTDQSDLGLNAMWCELNEDSNKFITNDFKNYFQSKANSEKGTNRKTDLSAGSSCLNYEDSLSLWARMSDNLSKSLYNTNNCDVNSSYSQSSNSKANSPGNNSHILHADFEGSVEVCNYNDEVDDIVNNLLDDEIMINQRDKKSGHYCNFNRKSDEKQRELIWTECSTPPAIIIAAAGVRRKSLKEKKSIPQSTYEKLALKTGLDVSQIKKINYNMRCKLKKQENSKFKDY